MAQLPKEVAPPAKEEPAVAPEAAPTQEEEEAPEQLPVAASEAPVEGAPASVPLTEPSAPTPATAQDMKSALSQP